MTKREAKRKCERIARQAGAKLTWLHDGEYGYYIPGTNKIHVGDVGNIASVVTIFCHELAHYKNYLDGKYSKYHRLGGKAFMKRFKTKDALIRYALKAEIYTDKRGKKLCAEYFPGIRFKKSYKMNQRFYDYMYEKYFGGYIIIMIDDKNALIVKNNLTNNLIYDMVE